MRTRLYLIFFFWGGGGAQGADGDGGNDGEEHVEARGERMTPAIGLISPNGKCIPGGIEGHVSRVKWRQLEMVVTTGGRTKRRGRREFSRLEISRGEIPWAVQSHNFVIPFPYFFFLMFGLMVDW